MADKKVVKKVEKIEKKANVNAGVYDILRHPIISEKAARLSENNGVVFEVAIDATKKDVAKAILAIYNLAPVKINIVNTKGKFKVFRGKSKGTQKSFKKAYITFAKGQTIDILAETAKK